jgi:hypothetical protein
MAQQFDEASQDSLELYETPAAHQLPGQEQHPVQKSGIFIELRFAVALSSVIALLAVSGVNLVIVRLFENVLSGWGAYNQGSLRVLAYTLPTLVLAILLAFLLTWINRFVARQANNSHPIGEKLTIGQPPSLAQSLGLAFISLSLPVALYFTILTYIRLLTSIIFAPYYGTTEIKLAAIPILTAAILVVAAFWINVIFHTKRS